MTPEPSVVSIGRPGSPERELYVSDVERQYHPPETGLHVCGFNEDLRHGPHFTIMAFPLAADRARAAFARAKAEYAVSAEEGDVVVDFYISGSLEDDFLMRRQMAEPMQREIARG